MDQRIISFGLFTGFVRNNKNEEQHIPYPLKVMTGLIISGVEVETGESFHNDVMLTLDNWINLSLR